MINDVLNKTKYTKNLKHAFDGVEDDMELSELQVR